MIESVSRSWDINHGGRGRFVTDQEPKRVGHSCAGWHGVCCGKKTARRLEQRLLWEKDSAPSLLLNGSTVIVVGERQRAESRAATKVQQGDIARLLQNQN